MKKKIVGVAIIAAMAVAAGWNFNQSKNEVALTDLAMANVEALARGENADDKCDDFTAMKCYTSGVVYDNMYPVCGL